MSDKSKIIPIEERFLQYEFETGDHYKTLITVSQGMNIRGISRSFCEWLNNKTDMESDDILNNEEFIKFKNHKIEEQKRLEELFKPLDLDDLI